MKLTSILGGITAILSTILYFVIPAYRRKITRLQSEVADHAAEIKLVRKNEQIKTKADDLGFDELSSGLLESKTKDAS